MEIWLLLIPLVPTLVGLLINAVLALVNTRTTKEQKMQDQEFQAKQLQAKKENDTEIVRIEALRVDIEARKAEKDDKLSLYDGYKQLWDIQASNQRDQDTRITKLEIRLESSEAELLEIKTKNKRDINNLTRKYQSEMGQLRDACKQEIEKFATDVLAFFTANKDGIELEQRVMVLLKSSKFKIENLIVEERIGDA